MADFNSPYSCPSVYDNPVDFPNDLELQLWQFSNQSAIERMASLSDILPVLQNQVAVAGSNSHGAGLHMMDVPPPSFTENYSDFQTLNSISFSNHDAYEDNAILPALDYAYVPALDYVQMMGYEGLLESKNIAIAMIVPPERTRDEEAKNGISENQQRNNASLVVNDHSKLPPPRHVLAPPMDGHNWRKYGQKQVKNSNFPRSYYRCTHPNCKVTKKIEYSAQGHVTEIIYKGSHGHPKANPSSKFLMQQMAVGKRCIATAEMSSSARSACQPKYTIVIESDLEVFDDGFRWRKYGQKVVKGNSNPRSYYKCTHPECLVKKHVERSPNDSKLLLTTYEGHHEHEIPATREHMSNNLNVTVTPSLNSRGLRVSSAHHHNEAGNDMVPAEANREGFVGFEYPMPLNVVPPAPGTIIMERPPASANASFGLAIMPYEGHHEHEIPAARDTMSNNWSLNSRGLRVSSSHHHNEAGNDMALSTWGSDTLNLSTWSLQEFMISVEQLASANVAFGAASVSPLDSRMGMSTMPKVERTPELGASSSTAQLPLQAMVPSPSRQI